MFLRSFLKAGQTQLSVCILLLLFLIDTSYDLGVLWPETPDKLAESWDERILGAPLQKQQSLLGSGQTGQTEAGVNTQRHIPLDRHIEPNHFYS